MTAATTHPRILRAVDLVIERQWAALRNATRRFDFAINPPSLPHSVTLQTVEDGAGDLVPGAAWEGATAQPATVGDVGDPGYDAQCIARWDVVPDQDAATGFRVAVVAFHINGIDRVEFAVNGGAWIAVSEMTLNTQTGVWEYWCGLDLSGVPDGTQLEVRAIVYPSSAGEPRVLQDDDGQDPGDSSLYLWANDGGAMVNSSVVKYVAPVDHPTTPGNDTTGDGSDALPYATIAAAMNAIRSESGSSKTSGATIRCKAGTYVFADGSSNGAPDRWVHITRDPNAAKSSVVFVDGASASVQRRLHIHDVTLQQTSTVAGTWVFRYASTAADNAWWIDNCDMIGSGNQIGSEDVPGTIIRNANGTKCFYTDCTIDEVKPCEFTTGVFLVRNLTGSNFGADVFSTIRILAANVDANHTRIDSGTGVHSDGIQSQSGSNDNGIFYNVKITDLAGQGIAITSTTGTTTNLAFVNCVMGRAAGFGYYSYLPWGTATNHILMWNCTQYEYDLRSTLSGSAPTNFSLRGCVYNSIEATAAAMPTDAAHNHFVDGSGAPGSDVSTGDPGFTDAANFDYTLDAGSSLIDRMAPLSPADVANNARHSSLTSVGAYAASGEAA